MKRIYKQLLDKYLSYFPCVAVIGARQCGKTTFLEELPEGWRVFDLEKGSDYDLISSDPDLFFRLNNANIAIDEAQVLPRVFQALRVAIDSDRGKTGRFVLTGSASPELMRRVTESLAGRVGIIEMAPLTAGEAFERPIPLFYDWLKTPLKKPDCEDLSRNMIGVSELHDYWFRGGYPEPWIKRNADFRMAWVDNYFQSYVFRDLAQLFPGLNRERFRLFIQMLSGLSGKILNFSDVARVLHVTQPVVKDYFEIAHGLFLWRNLPAFSRKILKRLVRHPKGYMRDSGLLHRMLRIPDLDALRVHPICGQSWEGTAIEQILRGLNASGIGHEYSYYRSAGGAEVDLVLEGDFGLLPVEIKYGQTVSMRDLQSLRSFVTEHDCRYGLVVNNDERARFYDDKLLGVPLGCL